MAIEVSQVPSKAGATSAVASAGADTSILAAAGVASRLGFAVENDSTAILYLLLSNGVASATNYTVKMAAGSYYEGPYNYQGPVRGFWAAVNGFAYVTEFR